MELSSESVTPNQYIKMVKSKNTKQTRGIDKVGKQWYDSSKLD